MNYVFIECPYHSTTVDIYYENSFKRKWKKSKNICCSCQLTKSQQPCCATARVITMPEGILILEELGGPE